MSQYFQRFAQSAGLHRSASSVRRDGLWLTGSQILEELIGDNRTSTSSAVASGAGKATFHVKGRLLSLRRCRGDVIGYLPRAVSCGSLVSLGRFEVKDGVLHTSRRILRRGIPPKCEEIIHKGMQNNTGLRWSIGQSVWSFGASDVADFLKKIESYTMAGIAGQIECPCLVMEAEADMFLSGQPQKIYDALKAPKNLVKFTREDGAENHCQSGALAYKDEVVFNWLDETLRVQKPASWH